MDIGESSSEPVSRNDEEMETNEELEENGKKKHLNIFDLNDDCLIPLFGFLESKDMLNAAFTCTRFYKLIHEMVSSHSCFRFSEIKESCLVQDIFRSFGKKITKLELCFHDVQVRIENYTVSETVLKLIERHCLAENLVELNIGLNLGHVSQQVKNEFAPMMKNIRKLWMSSNHSGGIKSTIKEVIEFISHCVNLEELTILNVTSREPLKKLKIPFSKLKKLTIHRCVFADTSILEAIFIRNPNIKSIGYSKSATGRDSNLIEQTVEHLPDLEELELDHYSTPSNDILKLSKLRALKINSRKNSCEDIYSFIKKISEKNTIERLRIDIEKIANGSDETLTYNFDADKKFTNLKYLTINTPVQQSASFLVNFFENTPNLKECILISEKPIPQSIIIGLVANATILSKLKLDAPYNIINKTLYQKLLDLRLRRQTSRPLEFYAHEMQVKYFFDKNVESLYDANVLTVTAIPQKKTTVKRCL